MATGCEHHVAQGYKRLYNLVGSWRDIGSWLVAKLRSSQRAWLTTISVIRDLQEIADTTVCLSYPSKQRVYLVAAPALVT